MEPLESIFSKLIRICHVRTVCDQLVSDVGTLNKYIEKFDFNVKENCIHVDTGDLDEIEVDIKDRGGPEKEILEAARTSPYRKHFQKLSRSEEEKVPATEERGTANMYYKPSFIHDINERFMGTIPLWSGLLLGNLRRHGEGAAYMAYKEKRIFSGMTLANNFKSFTKDNRTLGVSDRIMRVLFNQQLGGTIKVRLDDFVREVHEDLIGMQRIFADQYRKKRRRQAARNGILEEKWDKKHKGF